MTSELTPAHLGSAAGPGGLHPGLAVPASKVPGAITDMHGLEAMAAHARSQGFYLRAADLYHEAAREAFSVEERLHLTMREAHCRLQVDDREAAEQIAQDVATQARTEECYAELADALGLLVEMHMMRDEYAEASEKLAEAMWVLLRVPDDPAYYQVIHNMAVTYQRCDFPLPAIELYDRALHLAPDEAERAITHANMASALHMAMNYEGDPEAASRHLHDGIYAATAALDTHHGREVVTEATALAHRSVMLNAIGHHDAALHDALRCRELAERHELQECEVVAMVGEAVARWHLERDPGVLQLIFDAAAMGKGLGIGTYLKSSARVSIDILWESGRYDEAREVMNRQFEGVSLALRREREARWEHVRLGVSLRNTAAIGETDPLTNLPNRRFLHTWLPSVLEQCAPVCVALLDLDGFKAVNDDLSYEHGDALLQELAGVLQRICRRGDAVVRLGGDEFLIVLRETSPGDARNMLDRVRTLIGNRPWQGLPPEVQVTASIGVAVGSGADDTQRVLAAAGEALHEAKRAGRDRIVFR
ncbi:MAG: GGDEF domain-containing protein [Acidimicrobiales bacterium]|nr:GGDEF domain-containing protein [Acidimicrobiales bacterium]MCB9392628.1 GGDEF domain-containing protein [Acidimicrobiaceae bacterium]